MANWKDSAGKWKNLGKSFFCDFHLVQYAILIVELMIRSLHNLVKR